MKLKTREVAIFGMLGALMYASKVFMELLPNVHLLGVFTISFTLVYVRPHASCDGSCGAGSAE